MRVEQTEIEAALNLGVTPDRIIFAHPCKMQSHLIYAAEKGIRLMTFDTVSELKKVKRFLPAAEYVYPTYVVACNRWASLVSRPFQWKGRDS